MVAAGFVAGASFFAAAAVFFGASDLVAGAFLVAAAVLVFLVAVAVSAAAAAALLGGMVGCGSTRGDVGDDGTMQQVQRKGSTRWKWLDVRVNDATRSNCSNFCREDEVVDRIGVWELGEEVEEF
jgi:hypothetical protein